MNLRNDFEYIQYDTQAKRLKVLEAISQLSDDCVSSQDRTLLLMAFDIVSSINLVTYR